ncbi:MAG TPA: prolyl oligopeptidase family serine peptidase [Trebonia sp.]|nr:prolyl oligopeptidase family serine peptidase [Trebonia sp.]
MTDDSFPRQQARTRRFTLGVPRAFSVSPDGSKVLFLRTRDGEDPVTCLWEADAGSGAERLVADPVALGADEDNLPAEERARRERVRETASGIVAYATDKAHALAVFALSGQVYAVDLTDPAGGPRPVPARVPALDPRPDPTGTRVAYVHAGALRVHDLATGADAAVTPVPEDDNVTYGLAEFIAAEEMERTRGYWWSPDGTRLLVERADTTPVQRWHIADPANPGREPNVVPYPAAGTPNADVQLCTVAADPTASAAGRGVAAGAGADAAVSPGGLPPGAVSTGTPLAEAEAAATEAFPTGFAPAGAALADAVRATAEAGADPAAAGRRAGTASAGFAASAGTAGHGATSAAASPNPGPGTAAATPGGAASAGAGTDAAAGPGGLPPGAVSTGSPLAEAEAAATEAFPTGFAPAGAALADAVRATAVAGAALAADLGPAADTGTAGTATSGFTPAADAGAPGTVPTADVADDSAAGAPGAVRAAGDLTTGGGLATVEWDRGAFPYLVTAAWGARMLVVVMSRDQRVMRVLDGESGQVLREDADPHWVDVITGVPAQLAGGDVVWTAVSGDTRGLVIAAADELQGAQPVTPPGLEVRRVLATDGDAVYFSASTEPTEAGVYRYSRAGGLEPVATAPGTHSATARAGTTVLVSSTLATSGSSVTVFREGQPPAPVASHARQPSLPAPTPHFLAAGPAGIRTAVLFPSWHVPGSGKLPVLMDPYGGPHAQRVVKTASAFLTSQWLAEQGFAVVVADGRGTAGRGPAWDRAIAGDLATGVLADQVTALHAAAAEFPDLDLERVAIRGWSFGGFLAALAALRRPDVFHAAIAGAPVTDWRLYDTCYTERYLGDPATAPEAYHRSSLTAEDIAAGAATGDATGAGTGGATGAGTGNAAGAGDGDGKRAALLLIHGLADDNVVVAHTLRLSSLLLAAGYPHSVLPLSGVTHMTPQEVVAENMLLVQVAFLRDALRQPSV